MNPRPKKRQVKMVGLDVLLPEPHAAALRQRAAEMVQGRSTLLRRLVLERLDTLESDPLPAPAPLEKTRLTLPPAALATLKEVVAAIPAWGSVSELIRAIVAEWVTDMASDEC